MKILAIETSCDETAIALLEASGDASAPSFDILANKLLSQAMKHREFGGVYPNLAKREHAKNLVPILLSVLDECSPDLIADPAPLTDSSKSRMKELLEREEGLYNDLVAYLATAGAPCIDAIAVTQGPGLEPALWVGVNFAKALAIAWDIPLVPINHMEGHVLSVLTPGEVTKVAFPAIALLVSGGHTELILVRGWGDYELIGRTRDDAVGEAFDKVARMLGLPYPGGPEIGRLAAEARAQGLQPKIPLPRPMMDTDSYDFSYSGLKTAVLRIVEQQQKPLSKEFVSTLAREFEDAALDVLIAKSQRALTAYGAQSLIVGGGVIANKELRRRLSSLPDVHLHMPELNLTTDNAVMIGMAAYMHLMSGGAALQDFDAKGNLRIA